MICALTLSALTYAENDTWIKLKAFSDEIPNIRGAGSEAEYKALQWLKKEYSSLGYRAEIQPFPFKIKNKTYHSNNLEVVINGESSKTIIVGAHYDGVTGTGSKGFIDNASGAIALLGIAEALKSKSLPYTVKLVHFGAEEVGIFGSRAYVNSEHNNVKNIIGMINLDTIIGGDYLYIHSAQTQPYSCKKINKPDYSSSPKLRNQLLSLSSLLQPANGFQIHPTTSAYKEGETGGWSDHYPFACKGIPVAYLESTNFLINGHSGYDGYSQTTDKQFWDCFNDSEMTACNRKTESKCGNVWHTKFDEPRYLLLNQEPKLKQQLQSSIKLISTFLM